MQTLVQNDVELEPEMQVLQTQHHQNTDLALAPSEFDPSAYQALVESAKDLKSLRRGASIVPKYFEFTTSVESVYTNAEKQKNDKDKQAYLEMNLPLTSTLGIFQGVSEEITEKTEAETGEITRTTRKIAKWVNEEGLFINFGAQLVRTLEHIPLGTAIEIVFLKEEAVQSTQGATVKIYEVYPLI
jgi:hypothetical protein